MHELLVEIKKKYTEDKYDEAIKLLDKAIDKCILYPEILLQKASCLQLSKNNNIKIEDIEKLYLTALSIDEGYYNSLIEFANFQFAVMDRTKLAKEYFEKALSVLTGPITETIIGIARCIEEIEDEKKAISYLSKANIEILNNKLVKEVIDEFKEIHD